MFHERRAFFPHSISKAYFVVVPAGTWFCSGKSACSKYGSYLRIKPNTKLLSVLSGKLEPPQTSLV